MDRSPTNRPKMGMAPGDRSSRIDAVYRAEAPRLSRYFRFRIGKGEDIGDLVQEAFLRFVRVEPDHKVENPAAYLHRIARNLLVDRSRRCKTGCAIVDAPLDSEDEIGVPADQAYQLEASQLMESYQEAVDALPPRTREVFLLHRIDELSYKEIAARLDIGVRTVEWHIAEALFRIRRALDDE